MPLLLMKRILLLLSLVIVLNVFSSAQKVINNPSFGSSLTSYIKIAKIELSDTATILHFKVIYRPGNWIQIDTNSYILPSGSQIKLSMKGTRGLLVGCNHKWIMPDSGVVHYSLIYPPLDSSVRKFDFIENEGSDWKIYDIALVPKKTILPEPLMGNWMENNSGSKWVLGLYDSIAIYKNKIWHYGRVSHQNSEYQLSLIAKGATTTLYLMGNDSGNCLVGESSFKKVECTHKMISITNHRTTSNESDFPSPFFQNGIATIKGYLNGYTPKTLMAVAEFSTPYDGGINVKANDDGTFEMKIPVFHPGIYQIMLPRIRKTDFSLVPIYLEAGKEVVCYFDIDKNNSAIGFTTDLSTSSLFMGDNGEVNNELFQSTQSPRIVNTDTTNYSDIDKFKQHHLELKKSNDAKVLTLMSTNAICEKTARILHANNTVNYCFSLLMYNNAREFNYKREKHITNYNKTYLEPVTLGFPYLNSVKAALKDTFCQTSKMFTSLLTTLKTLPEAKKPDYSLTSIMKEMRSRGSVFNADENTLYNGLISMKQPDNNATDSFELYEKLTKNFKRKYENTIDDIARELQTLTTEQYLKRYFGFPDFIADYFTLSENITKIKIQSTALDGREMKEVRKKMSNPAFADFLEDFNKVAIKPIKSNDGAVFKSTPYMSGDDAFESFIAQYRGKVVFLDFWETWCMPCKMGMAQIAPLKEELKDSDIVFVCVSSQSSPKDTWKVLTKGIRAEHYRLSQSEYYPLYQKFNIKTIPRYVLIGKDGKIVNSDVGHKSNEELKRLFLKLMKE